MIYRRSCIYCSCTIACISFLVLVCSPGAKTLYVPSKQARSISRAMIKSRDGDTILVKSGKYREHVVVESRVTLISEEQFGAVINGRGRGTVVTLATESVISGFSIRNGTHGVLSKGAGAQVQRCFISGNLGSGIITIGILCTIENNVIVYNRGAGIQGQDVRSDGSARIEHNTIAYNTSHGVSLDGAVKVPLKNNIIAFNERLGVKTGAETRDILLINNNLYGNHGKLHVLPSGNFSFDPLFVAPKSRKMNFALEENSPCRKRGDEGRDLGALVW
ncbi:MAG: hypothetical protein GF350_13995 [Chitinivibrionales bacterium]|nr:hypothetical protein [Chitinivibrionales bacterium]